MISGSLAKQKIFPYFVVAAFWLVAATLSSWALSGHAPSAARWSLILSVLSLFNLGALAKALAAVTLLVATDVAEREKRSALSIQAMVWGVLKLAFLGLLIFAIWSGRGAPVLALVFGLGTMIIVPLAGGYWVNAREVTHA